MTKFVGGISEDDTYLLPKFRKILSMCVEMVISSVKICNYFCKLPANA